MMQFPSSQGRNAVAIQPIPSFVMPAQAGIHNHRLWNMDSCLRGNDVKEEDLGNFWIAASLRSSQ